jgi:DnaJ homolog subfamily C member 28
MDEWHDLVSQRIEDAMRQGLFDNLSGRGKPLNLRRDPFLPEDQQMAVTLLRNNDLAPEWITERKIILAAIDALRADLHRAAGIMRCDLDAATDDVRREQLQRRWRLWLADWQARIDQLNRRILVQNLKQPVRHLEIYMLRLPEELARAGADAAWGAGPSEE